MTPRHTAFVRQNWLLLLAFAAAIFVALWFAVHFAMAALYFNDPDNVDVDLKPWMTPRYIVMTYDLPRDWVIEALELDAGKRGGTRLGHIAQELGITMEELTAMIRAKAAIYRESQQ